MKISPIVPHMRPIDAGDVLSARLIDTSAAWVPARLTDAGTDVILIRPIDATNAWLRAWNVDHDATPLEK